MTLAQSVAYETIRYWRSIGLQRKQAWYALTGEDRYTVTWEQVADRIVRIENERTAAILRRAA